MSTETKRKAIEAWMTAYNRHGASIAVDALEALMCEVADERIEAHRAVPEPRPEPAKCAECGGLGTLPGDCGDSPNEWRDPCPKCSKATPPSAKGPPETMPDKLYAWRSNEVAGGVWTTGLQCAADDWKGHRTGYTRDDLAAKQVEEALAKAECRDQARGDRCAKAVEHDQAREAMGVPYNETLTDAARRVVARVAESEAAVEDRRREASAEFDRACAYSSNAEVLTSQLADLRTQFERVASDIETRIQSALDTVQRPGHIPVGAQGSVMRRAWELGRDYHTAGHAFLEQKIRAERAEAELADVRVVSNARLDMVHKREAELAECKAKIGAFERRGSAVLQAHESREAALVTEVK